MGHGRRAGMSLIATTTFLCLMKLLIRVVIVHEVVARVYLTEVGALPSHLLVRIAQRSMNSHSIVHFALRLLWATISWLLSAEIFFKVLLVVARILFQLYIIVRHSILLSIVLHACVATHLLRHVVLRLVELMLSTSTLESVVVSSIVDGDVLIVIDDLNLLLNCILRV